MKFCKDCKHFSEAHSYAGDNRWKWRCDAGVYLVTGQQMGVSCEEEREAQGPNHCGQEGKWFKSKEPVR